MTRITTIGLDLAKKVFQVHGVDTEGKIIVARQLRRKQVLAFFAKLPPPWIGSAKEVADIFEEWFTSPACDGFVVGAGCVPGSYEDFVKFVVPELQKRRLLHDDYRGATLRENLGLPRPSGRS